MEDVGANEEVGHCSLGENSEEDGGSGEEVNDILLPIPTPSGFLCPVTMCKIHVIPKLRKSHVDEHIGQLHTDPTKWGYACGDYDLRFFKGEDCDRHNEKCQKEQDVLVARELIKGATNDNMEDIVERIIDISNMDARICNLATVANREKRMKHLLQAYISIAAGVGPLVAFKMSRYSRDAGGCGYSVGLF